MKIKLIRITLFIIIIELACSCASMYIPSSANIPLLESEGEKQVELTASTTSLNLSGDYAFSEKYACMFNGSVSYGNFTNYYDIFTPKECEWKIDYYGILPIYGGEFSHRYGEIGIGRYNILQNKIKLEIFGGLGYGQANDKKITTFENLNYNANYYLGFAQINFGKTTPKIDYGMSLRLAYSSFDFSSHDIYLNPNLSTDIVDSHKLIFNIYHGETMGFLRFGNNRIKCVVRIGLSIAKKEQSLENINLYRGIHLGNVNTTNILLSMGINYKFGLN
jgi:hypothetical protein